VVEIGVGGGVAQDATRGHDLAFVMEGVGEDVMKDQRGSADGDISVGKAQLRIGVELLIRYA